MSDLAIFDFRNNQRRIGATPSFTDALTYATPQSISLISQELTGLRVSVT
jgi:hypothetical protein